MANRLRADFLEGVCSITAGNPATLTTTTNVNVAIPSGYYLPIVLNPPPFGGSVVNSEIVYTEGVYSSGSTIFTVSRAEEGTTSLGAQTSIPWISGPTTQDFGILNGMLNGDFPIPTGSGQYLAATASGIGTVTWHVGTSTATVSGSQLVGWIPGALISGTLSGPNVTLSGSDIAGNIQASQLTGNISNATISGSKIVSLIPSSTVSGILINSPLLLAPRLDGSINATTPNGLTTINVDTAGTSIFYETVATANFVFNITTSVGSLNYLLNGANEIVLDLKITQGNPAYYCTNIEIDGAVQSVYWQGGAPTAGTQNSVDTYTISITRLAGASNYAVIASLNNGTNNSGSIWYPPSLQNSWAWATNSPLYRKISNQVFLHGIIFGGLTGTVAWNFNTDGRPQMIPTFPYSEPGPLSLPTLASIGGGFTGVSILIDTSGNVTPYFYTSIDGILLDGISYLVN